MKNSLLIFMIFFLFSCTKKQSSPPITGIITTVVGNGYGAGTGLGGSSGDGGQATAAELFLPSGIAVDGNGNLFIADNSNNRIRKVNASGVITTIAGANAPYAIAVDAIGNVYYTNDVAAMDSHLFVS